MMINLINVFETAVRIRYAFLASIPLLALSLTFGGRPAAAEPQDSVVRMGVNEILAKSFEDLGRMWWSDAVVHDIFKSAGYQIDVRTLSNRGLPHALYNEKIDFFTGTTESLVEFADGLLLSALPTVVVDYYIYFDHRNSWQPVWPPDDEFLTKIGKSTRAPSALKNRFELNISKGRDYEVCIKVVNSGRADYWIDSKAGYVSVDPALVRTEADGFTFKPLYKNSVYVHFQNTERGRVLQELFNKAHLKMLKEGRYVKVFYGNVKDYASTSTGTSTVESLRAQHPELEIPLQEQPH